MFRKLCLSDMMMYEQETVLSKKMDLKRVVDYKAIMMLLTRTWCWRCFPGSRGGAGQLEREHEVRDVDAQEGGET